MSKHTKNELLTQRLQPSSKKSKDAEPNVLDQTISTFEYGETTVRALLRRLTAAVHDEKERDDYWHRITGIVLSVASFETVLVIVVLVRLITRK